MFHSLKKCKPFLKCCITCRFTKILPIWLFWSFFGPILWLFLAPKQPKKQISHSQSLRLRMPFPKWYITCYFVTTLPIWLFGYFFAIFWPFFWPMFGSSLAFKKPKIQIKPCKSLRLCMLCPKSCPVSPVCNNLANLAVLAVLGPNWAAFGPFLAQKQPKIKISLFQPSRLCMPFPKRCHTCIFEKN